VLTHFDNPVVPEKASGKAREVWLLQNERCSLAFSQAQPEGPVLIFHSSALSLAHVEQPHHARAVLRDKK